MAVTPSVHLVRPLGRGGMGSVWVAEHRSLKTEVAVKFLQSDLLEYEGAIARFETEATAAAQIRNPHAVHVYDHGILDDELPYIVMELLTGEDLGTRIRRAGPLGYKEATALLAQLRRVLEKAHDLGIVHRDIKPDNIIVLSDYGDFFVKLIDFGIAKLMSSASHITSTGVVMGTPDYMCPEQFHDAREVGPAADWWSLAAVLFHSITGQRPFPGATLPAVIMAVEKGQLTLPYESYQMGSPAIDAFFKKALNRDPRLRFQGLGEMTEGWIEAVNAGAVDRTLSLPPPAPSPLPPDPMSVITRDDRPGRKRGVAASAGASGSPAATWAFPPEMHREPTPEPNGVREPAPPFVPNDNPTVGAIPSQMRRQNRAKRVRWIGVGLAGAVVVGVISFLFWRSVASPPTAVAPPEPAQGLPASFSTAVTQVEAPTAAKEPLPVDDEEPESQSDMRQVPKETASDPPTVARRPLPSPLPTRTTSTPPPTRTTPPKPKPAPAPLLKDRGF